MKKPNSIQFVLSAKKIISVNALYGAKLTYSGARPIATLYKKAEAKKFTDDANFAPVYAQLSQAERNLKD